MTLFAQALFRKDSHAVSLRQEGSERSPERRMLTLINA